MQADRWYRVSGEPPKCEAVELEPASEGRYWTPEPPPGCAVRLEFRPQADGWARTAEAAWALRVPCGRRDETERTDG